MVRVHLFPKKIASGESDSKESQATTHDTVNDESRDATPPNSRIQSITGTSSVVTVIRLLSTLPVRPSLRKRLQTNVKHVRRWRIRRAQRRLRRRRMYLDNKLGCILCRFIVDTGTAFGGGG